MGSRNDDAGIMRVNGDGWFDSLSIDTCLTGNVDVAAYEEDGVGWKC